MRRKSMDGVQKRIAELERQIKSKAAEKMPHSFVEMEWACGHICGAACVECKQKLEAENAKLEKEAEIKDTLAESVMILAELHEQLEDAKAHIAELEKYKKATLSVGIKVVEICMGCGKENCGNCPTGVTYTVRNVRAVELEAENLRLRDLLLEAIKWVDKYDWNQARGLEYKLKQALRSQGEEK